MNLTLDELMTLPLDDYLRERTNEALRTGAGWFVIAALQEAWKREYLVFNQAKESYVHNQTQP